MTELKSCTNRLIDQLTVRSEMLDLSKLISRISHANSLTKCWEIIGFELKQVGFDRLIYGRKLYPERSDHSNLTGTVIFSSYGQAVDRVFIDERGFAENIMVHWGVKNTGCLSWAESRAAYDSGRMTKQQKHIYEKTYSMGIRSGYTYACPIKPHFRSGFGLCFMDGFDQDHVDEIWRENEDIIVAILQIFDTAVMWYPHFEAHQKLTNKECETLILAAEGRTFDEISELLGKHRRTIDFRMTKAREKLGVGTTLQAVLKAARQGQI